MTADLFRNRGVPEISQALADALPSYNYPRPDLSQQQYFATTFTNFSGGVPFDITTFPAGKSVNFSVLISR